MRLHRAVMAGALAFAPEGAEVDHTNGDRLDCRRANLRIVQRTENCWNRLGARSSRSGFKGVDFDRAANRQGRPHPWRARIEARGRRRMLGYFHSPEAAAAAYAAAAHELHGNYARF